MKKTVLVLGVVMLFALPARAGFIIGVDLGFNLFQLMGSGEDKWSLSGGGYSDSGTEDFDYTADPSALFGIHGGYSGYNLAIGAALAFGTISGEIDFDEGGEGDVDVSVLKIEPFGQYLFETSYEGLFPFIGGGLNVQLNKMEPEGADEEDITMLGIFFMGGVKYFFTEMFGLFGGARLDYVMTISPATYEESESYYGDTIKLKEEISSSWVPLSLFAGLELKFGE